MSSTAARVAAGLLAAAAFALTSCSPVLTDDPYAASDGVRVVWSEDARVKGENIMLLASETGGDARLLGGLVNGTNEDIEVAVGFAGGAQTVIEIPANSTVLLDGSAANDVVLPNVPVAPGSFADLSLTTPSRGTVTVKVPVLDGTLAEYEPFVPGAAKTP